MLNQHLLSLLRNGEIVNVHSEMSEWQIVEILGRPEDIGRYMNSAFSLKYGNLQILFENNSITSFQLRPEVDGFIRIINYYQLLYVFHVPLNMNIILNELNRIGVSYELNTLLTFDSQITYHVGKCSAIACSADTLMVDYFSAFFYDYYVK